MFQDYVSFMLFMVVEVNVWVWLEDWVYVSNGCSLCKG